MTKTADAAPVHSPALVSGAKLWVVAPSGPVDPQRLKGGLARLRHGREIEIALAPNLETRAGYFAGDDEVRLAALQTALDDPQARVIWCARGGYGLTRLLRRLDPTGFVKHPKTIVGFSDATALCAWAARHEVAAIHGPVLAQLGEVLHEDVDRVFDLLEGRIPNPLVAGPGTVLNGGRVAGPLHAGNIEVLRSLVGTPFSPSLAGAILAIEEVGERPYRIDRALTQLLESKALDGVRGIAVGQLHGCTEPSGGGSHGATAQEVVVERLGRLGVPLVTGFAFGHDRHRNAALPVGSMVELDADAGSLTALTPVTVVP